MALYAREGPGLIVELIDQLAHEVWQFLQFDLRHHEAVHRVADFHGLDPGLVEVLVEYSTVAHEDSDS